tara:strand:- start:89 stop:304 length:216 start_codon:yes stop_codon:yes gene_type:complete
MSEGRPAILKLTEEEVEKPSGSGSGVDTYKGGRSAGADNKARMDYESKKKSKEGKPKPPPQTPVQEKKKKK